MSATIATTGSALASPRSGPTNLPRQRALAILRITFGLAWTADATLKWLPGFADTTFLATLRDARDGQPAAIRAWITLWINLFAPNPHGWAIALAIAESLIAVGLIAGAVSTLVCVGGGLLSLAIWTTAEGFGGPYTNGSTDISASIIYVMMFAALAITAAGGYWGVDARLRSRLGPLRWLCATSTWQPRPPTGARRG